MARIRTIKPEFPQSESMGRVGREARLCFILLWTLADDAGRLRGNSRMLASLLYPYDDDAKRHIEGWLNELHTQNCIVRYESDGDQYIEICKWLIHQKIDKPSPSKLPAPDCNSRGFASPREDSVAEGKGKEGNGKEGKGIEPQAASVIQPFDVSDSVWADFLKHRKGKKAPLTQTAMDGIVAEVAKAGWSLEAALTECCTRGWTGFKAEWVANKAMVNGKGRLLNKAEQLVESNRAVGDEWLAEMQAREAAGGETIEGEAHEV